MRRVWGAGLKVRAEVLSIFRGWQKKSIPERNPSPTIPLPAV